MIDSFGLQQNDLNIIVSILTQYSQVRKALIFGSRAKGVFRNGSDIDIALKGDALNADTLSRISYILNEETNLPYHIDLLNYHTIHNKELVEHIDRVGICFYPNEKQ
jgi:predicted nucleotidyltransferase